MPAFSASVADIKLVFVGAQLAPNLGRILQGGVMEYKVDCEISVDEFLELANSNWPGKYNREKTEVALTKTININARDNGKLNGCLRIISDGYFFSSIPDAFVLPERQGEGIGSKLFELAKKKITIFIVLRSTTRES